MATDLRSSLLGIAALCALVACAGCGRVTRQMSVNSEPQGALVYLNGQEVGRTPCVVDFTWYGRYDVALRKEGYTSLKTTRQVTAPWWQWIPMDLLADATPGRKVDRRYYHYVLQPLPEAGVDAQLLIDRAQSMRPMLESGQYTRKPTPAPATTQPAETSPTTAPSF